ncbi:hypothetical protein LN996_07295 [Arthrobacter sp. AK01]|uniref:hypothetical protein n=1 Tax=Arthrobacter sp. AK01 TaxID=2894084 RepID=UPI001E4C7116|nr:hypothetical protein [Arthrobacter sp. AK01]MCD4850611.1 hypothetical protein [Arthrobacter sp. AK01]
MTLLTDDSAGPAVWVTASCDPQPTSRLALVRTAGDRKVGLGEDPPTSRPYEEKHLAFGVLHILPDAEQ